MQFCDQEPALVSAAAGLRWCTGHRFAIARKSHSASAPTAITTAPADRWNLPTRAQREILADRREGATADVRLRAPIAASGYLHRPAVQSRPMWAAPQTRRTCGCPTD